MHCTKGQPISTHVDSSMMAMAAAIFIKLNYE